MSNRSNPGCGEADPRDPFGGMTVGEFNMLSDVFLAKALGRAQKDLLLTAQASEPTSFCPGCGEREVLKPDLCADCLEVNA